MSTITISLPADRLQKLRELATQFHVAPEELVRATVEELLNRPKDEFQQTVEYVLKKNEELYKRLA
jgi:antitoxin FitA